MIHLGDDRFLREKRELTTSHPLRPAGAADARPHQATAERASAAARVGRHAVRCVVGPRPGLPEFPSDIRACVRGGARLRVRLRAAAVGPVARAQVVDSTSHSCTPQPQPRAPDCAVRSTLGSTLWARTYILLAQPHTLIEASSIGAE